MRSFDYSSPGSVREGLQALSAGSGNTRLLAGGTDLLPLMKAKIESPHTVLSVRRMRELSGEIVFDDGGVELGALASLADIASHSGISTHYPALSRAALSAATPQLRNMATLGGTLLQRPRCWYFRDASFKCWLKGGGDCNARDGQNQHHAIFETSPCCAVHPSDLAVVLRAFDAEVSVQASRGKRTLPLADFFAPPEADRRRETVLAPDELVLAVRVARATAGERNIFLKTMDRSAWAFATVSVAASLDYADGKIDRLAVVLGGVATVPWCVNEAMQSLVGAAPSEAGFEAAARAALSDAQPLRLNGYKVPLAQALINRALRLHTR